MTYLRAMLQEDSTTRKNLEKLHGQLNYVADIEPFGRPFLAHLTNAMVDRTTKDEIRLSNMTKESLKIWEQILLRNKGVSFDFVLNKLPHAKSNIFVDASTSWGIGCCCGKFYFYIQ